MPWQADACQTKREVLQSVLNGLAGALYGPSNPAGTFNYVLKRPTAKNLRRFNIGYNSQASASAHADLGGHFGLDQRFGYRINLLKEGGEGISLYTTPGKIPPKKS